VYKDSVRGIQGFGARAPYPLCNAAAERGMAKRGTEKERL
jgi:hypothetical protein